MEIKHTFKILLLLVFYSSALIGILLPMGDEIAEVLPGIYSEAQIIFISSIFLMVGASFSFVWAFLSTKYSRKKLLIVATLDWSIVMLITPIARDFISLLVFQILTAIGFGAVLPLTYSMIVDLFDIEKRGHAFGLKETIYVLGVGAAQVLSGFLTDLYEWYVPLILISMGGFICIILLSFMEEPQKSVREENKDLQSEPASWISRNELRDIWKIKSNRYIFFTNFIMFIGIGAISQELIRLLELDYNFVGSFATVSLILVFITQVPSGIIFGNLGDKKIIKDRNGRIKIVLTCLLCGSTLYIVGFFMVFPEYDALFVTIFLIILALGAFFFGGIDPSMQASLGDVNISRFSATSYAINNLTYTFGRSISLLILGILFFYVGSYRPGFIILSIIALISSLILIALMKVFPSEIIESDIHEKA